MAGRHPGVEMHTGMGKNYQGANNAKDDVHVKGTVEYCKSFVVSSAYESPRLTRKNSGVFKKARPVLPSRREGRSRLDERSIRRST